MATLTVSASRNGHRHTTFEDLKGLRAEGYVRDSTLDQRDGFGPDIQHGNIRRFAQSYGLLLGDRWYTEFVSGRYASKRQVFHQFIQDAELDLYDVLLVDHTSRFGRNQAECIRYKERLQELGKVVVFVSQGIISGSDRDFLSERINETLDEQYSRNLSRYVSEGMALKAAHGLANGVPPFGYRSEFEGPNRRERKVVDPETMPALLSILGDYASGRLSYRQVADRATARGFRTRKGNPITGHFVKDILTNRFYEGKVVFHEGLPDEQVFEGSHEVSEELKRLWLKCQEVKRQRRTCGAGHPRGPKRHYPFSTVLKCHRCGKPYYGEAVRHGDWSDLRLTHERRADGRNCDVSPRSRSIAVVSQEFSERVLPYLDLPSTWKEMVIEALQSNKAVNDDDAAIRKSLERALENLRKQHLWGDIGDDEYKAERRDLDMQLKLATSPQRPSNLPNLERAAQLLSDLPSLWSHPGVTHAQREALVQEVFEGMTIDGWHLMRIEPKPVYQPLFAVLVVDQASGVGYRGMASSYPRSNRAPQQDSE